MGNKEKKINGIINLGIFNVLTLICLQRQDGEFGRIRNLYLLWFFVTNISLAISGGEVGKEFFLGVEGAHSSENGNGKGCAAESGGWWEHPDL